MTKLSHTSVSKYNECSLCYKLHYIDSVRPIRTKSALLFGGALDSALNDLLLNKDLNKAKIVFQCEWIKIEQSLVDFSKSDLDQELVDFVEKTETKFVDEGSTSWKSLLYKGMYFLEQYNKEVLPKIKKVISIQEPVSLKNDDGDEITGFLDLIVEWEDGKIYLLDNKSSSVKYEPDSAKTGQQLPLYYYICKEKYKLDGVGYIVLSKKINKNKVKICSYCGVKNEGSYKKCNNELIIKDGFSKIRCNGEFEVTINPTVELQFIFNQIEESDEERVLKTFDDANYGISNNIFSYEHNSKRGKFGFCPYHDFYEGHPDFYKIGKK